MLIRMQNAAFSELKRPDQELDPDMEADIQPESKSNNVRHVAFEFPCYQI